MERLQISKRDILDAALIFGGVKQTFTAHDFTCFLRIQAHTLEEESVDEVLSELAESGQIRRIGPGVYARPAKPPGDAA